MGRWPKFLWVLTALLAGAPAGAAPPPPPGYFELSEVNVFLKNDTRLHLLILGLTVVPRSSGAEAEIKKGADASLAAIVEEIRKLPPTALNGRAGAELIKKIAVANVNRGDNVLAKDVLIRRFLFR